MSLQRAARLKRLPSNEALAGGQPAPLPVQSGIAPVRTCVVVFLVADDHVRKAVIVQVGDEGKGGEVE